MGQDKQALQRISVRKKDLEKVVQEIISRVKGPLFRGLGQKAQKDYESKGVLMPYCGSLGVGEGVFFTSDLCYALSFMKGILVISSREKLDGQGKAIDTREKAYETEAREKLDMELGAGNYDGWRLWGEIQKSDTITYEGGPQDSYVYSRREPVTKGELLAEIRILEEHDPLGQM
ncbi:MAG: hypothetical protein ABIB71_00565 [Candidatus Woesearchaeota archaeon]